MKRLSSSNLVRELLVVLAVKLLALLVIWQWFFSEPPAAGLDDVGVSAALLGRGPAPTSSPPTAGPRQYTRSIGESKHD